VASLLRHVAQPRHSLTTAGAIALLYGNSVWVKDQPLQFYFHYMNFLVLHYRSPNRLFPRNFHLLQETLEHTLDVTAVVRKASQEEIAQRPSTA
jgi:hypothetical protein